MDRFLAISAVFLPALGLIAQWKQGPFSQEQHQRRLACSLCAFAGIAAAALFVIAFRANAPLASVHLFDWVSLASIDDLQIKFSLRADLQSAAFLCGSNLLACLLLASVNKSPLNVLQLVAVNLLFVSENGVQTFFCWEVISVSSYFLIRENSVSSISRSSYFLIVQLISDLCLLFAVTVLWKQTGSFDYAVIFSKEFIQAVSLENTHSMKAAATFVFFAVAGRLVLLPFTIPLNPAGRFDYRKPVWLIGVVLFPSSLSLLVQLQPVFLASTNYQQLLLLIAGVGVVSGVWTVLQIFGIWTATMASIRFSFERIFDSVVLRPLQLSAMFIQWLERLVSGWALPRLSELVSASMDQTFGVLKTGDVLFYALSVILTATVLVVVLVGMQG